ncbi:uncharacterized protein [Argopecten irradians]|uniref:uncharacterized protein n=1 Tax=Argopecten irradians TaxID=31199 RepID=UPI00371E4B77
MSETTKENVNLIPGKNGVEKEIPNLEKARNRMVAEGYKYHALDGSLSGSDSESCNDSMKKSPGEWKRRNQQFICFLVFSVCLIAILAIVVIWQYQNRYTGVNSEMDIQPVIDVINRFGSWTFSNTSQPWNNNTWDFMDTLVKIASSGLHDPFLAMGVGNDDRNNTVNIINIQQSGLTLGSCEMYYTNNSKYPGPLKDAYIDYGTKWTVYLGAEETIAKAKMEAIYNFEQQLALIQSEAWSDPGQSYPAERPDPVESCDGYPAECLTWWAMIPTEVNAYYSPTYNSIAFPAGILQKPFFDPDFPVPFNFGTVGMIIGHELTHGFDNSGRKFDLHGNLHNWWTNASIDGFKRHAGCMVKQYSSYVVEGIDIHIRGDTTLGENIADNGGIKTAYQAYRQWRNSHSSELQNLPGLDLDDDQLFFVGFSQLWCSYYTPAYAKQSIITDEHTYARYRVIGALSNSDAFARAFHCPANTPMNPDHKCVVW